MQTYTDIQQLQHNGPTALTIGNFDGVHLGHQALLHTVLDVARALPGTNATTALVTFEPHPLKVLRPELPLDLLTTPPERLLIAAGADIDIGLIQPFTPELAALDAHEFLSLLKKHVGMAALIVGPDFALGRNRSGTLDTLTLLGDRLDFRFVVQDLIARDQRSVRSRTIRQLLGEGDVVVAAELLGRPYHMAGEVQLGDQRGRQFGIPTANVAVSDDKLWPASGVYATRTWVIDERLVYPSVTNIGFRPTVDGRTRRVESHLLDFPARGHTDNLYGRQLAIEFVHRLRGEVKFDGPEELVAQIYTDIGLARQILTDLPPASDPFFMTPLT